MIPGWQNTADQKIRSKYGSLAGWVSILINLLLTLIKGTLGIITGSVAVIADSFHTLSDVSTSAVILIFYRLSSKPPDEEHPYGHGRMEAIGTVIVSVVLFLISIELLKDGIHYLIHPQEKEASWIVIVIILFTIIVKEMLARFTAELGFMIKSNAIKADSWHHRTDAISSFFVAAALAAQNLKIFFLDGLSGVLIALMIGYIAWEFLVKGIDELLGKKAPYEFVQKVKNVVRDFPQVLDMHGLIIHRYGQNTIGSLHIEISEDFSLKNAHNIADNIEKILDSLLNLHVTIHIDPVDNNNSELKEIRQFLNGLPINKSFFSFHDLRMIKSGKGKTLIMDLSLKSHMNRKKINKIKFDLESLVTDNFNFIDNVIFEINPEFML